MQMYYFRQRVRLRSSLGTASFHPVAEKSSSRKLIFRIAHSPSPIDVSPYAADQGYARVGAFKGFSEVRYTELFRLSGVLRACRRPRRPQALVSLGIRSKAARGLVRVLASPPQEPLENPRSRVSSSVHFAYRRARSGFLVRPTAGV